MKRFLVWLGVISFCISFWILVLSAICRAECRQDVVIDMEKIKIIESSGNPKAHRITDDSIGLYQITPIVLKEWNNFNEEQLTRKDLWDADINFRIANWYMNYRIPFMLCAFGIEDTIENRIIAYNAGISYLVKNKPIPQITRNYIKKYLGDK